MITLEIVLLYFDSIFAGFWIDHRIIVGTKWDELKSAFMTIQKIWCCPKWQVEIGIFKGKITTSTYITCNLNNTVMEVLWDDICFVSSSSFQIREN